MCASQSHRRPILGITPGDPAGVGPELIRRCLADPALPSDVEWRVLGGDTTGFRGGHPEDASARFALDALGQAADLLRSGELAGVVTGPIHKARMAGIGFPFPGQTEYFAAAAGVKNFAMCLTGGPLTVALATIHEPLARVPALLCPEEIVRVGLLLVDFLRQRDPHHPPRVAVAGLNPHAGEGGSIGREELEIIAPAVRALRAAAGDAVVDGPFPPDTVFRAAVAGEWGAVLCMYHDQGLIPLKLLAFDQGVNVTLGLPFIRTSPDHGTAFDIAGRGLARHDSFMAAMHLAAELARRGLGVILHHKFSCASSPPRMK